MFIGIAINLTARLLSSSSPASLFANGEPGVWYDPSGISTLFQDSAGATPVTAPGQTVGLMLDNSKNGVGSNGAYIRNQYLYTEQFNNAYWSKNTGTTVGTDLTPAPNGTMTADKIQETAITSFFSIGTNPTASFSTTYTWSCYAKAAERNFLFVNFSALSLAGTFNLTTGQTNALIGSPSLSAVFVSDGWWRCSMTFTTPASGTNLLFQIFGPATAAGTTTYAGTAGYGLYVWGAQLELGSPATAYQQITSSWLATIPGNHATQATAVQRPTYGVNPIVGVRNLLTYTEQFENAVWTKNNTTIAIDQTAAPNGTITADKLQENAGAASFFAISGNPSASASTTYTWSCYFKAAERSFAAVNFSTAGVVAAFDLTTGETRLANGTATLSATNAGNGWWRFSVTFSTPSSGTSLLYHAISTALSLTVGVTTGVAGYGYYLWGAQIELGSTATAYQKVVSQYDVTQANVQSVGYLAFDGVDDGMVTGTITPGTNKAQVFTGVRKLSDAVGGVVAELSAAITSNAGTFVLTAPRTNAAANYNFSSKGTTQTDNVVTTYTAPITNVVTGLGDISGASNLVRVNGSQVGSTLTTQGTGNYLAYPLYIGRRGGATSPFNGRLYSMIVRFGPNLTTGQITSTESWVNSKTGAY